MPDELVQQNIRVAVRCRPLNKFERENNETSCVNCSQDKVSVRDRNSSKVFTFDQVFGPFSKQIDVYKAMVAPAVEEILMGYNCTIFAYGQTGSGKTFTMTGERSDKLRYAWEDDPMVGIIPRALSHLFESLERTGSDFSVRVSFLEVYNEELFDLLAVTDTNRLAIYDDINRKGSVIVKGLREIVVLDKDNVHSVIERGLARRQTASTLLNAQSSRSHSIFTVTVHIKEIHPVSGEELLRIGKLHLVDLAGSESIGRSGAIDKRAREAGSINQSLLTLGRVITALVDHTPHVPYRESKLTRLLQDSLGGKTKTSIIATINPSSLSLDETLSTLDYAHRAKNIKNRPELNVRLNKTDLVRSYNEELERLRRDLEAARTKTGIFVDVENYQTLQNQIKQQRERICELEERREMQENEMNQLLDMFTMSQTELTEARDRQEQITNELKACQSDLEEKQLHLLKLKFRLEEEEHLRHHHEQTEITLRQQATDLLNTARNAIGDVTTLHEKVNRLTELDKRNRDQLSHLASTWTVDRISNPANLAARLSDRLTVFCKHIQNSVSDLRTQNELLTSELLCKQVTLKESLAQCLASECIHAADQTDKFAQEQLLLSRQCLDETLRPQSRHILTMHEAVLKKVDEMSDILKNHNAAIHAWNEGITKVTEFIVQLSKQSSEYLDQQQQLSRNLHISWDSYCSRRAGFVRTLQSALNSLNAEHDSMQELVSTSLTSDCKRLEEWRSSHDQSFDQLKVLVSETRKSAFDMHDSFSTVMQDDLGQLSTSLHALGSQHDSLQTKVDTCLAKLCEQATVFSVDGLGAELRQRAKMWKDPMSAEVTNGSHASAQLNELVRTTHDGMTSLSEANTEKALAIENLSGDISYETSVEFARLKGDLQSVPDDLNSQLFRSLQHYSPTGQTPQPKSFSYPDRLAQTASHGRLRRAFRAMQLEPGLEQLLTPLSSDKSLDPIRESSDGPGNEENRVSANTPIRGKIISTLSENKAPVSPTHSEVSAVSEEPVVESQAEILSTPIALGRRRKLGLKK